MRSRFVVALGVLALVLVGSFVWAQDLSAWTGPIFVKKESPASVFTAPEYNAYNDFSLTQDANSTWQYGFTADPASNAFQPLSIPNSTTSCGPGTDFQGWSNPNPNDAHLGRNSSPASFTCGALRLPIGVIYMHPGIGGQRSVVRWKAPTGGSYQVTGAFQGLNGGYREGRILKNGVVVGTLNDLIIAGYGQQSFNFNVTVAAGDTIDFSLGWGDGSWNSDGTGLSVTIGEPATACIPAAANLQVNVPAENSPVDVQTPNTNASLVGNATYTNAGKVGRAFTFDGAGDYVRIEDDPSQRPTNQITIEGWYKFNSLGGLPHLISKPLRNSPFNSYAIWYDAGNIRIGYYETNGNFLYHNTGYSPQTGVWNHYAMVLNTDDTGSTANTFKLFINGVEAFSGPAGLPLYYNGVNDSYQQYPLLIGADLENNNPQFFLDGAADEVSIYGRALAQSEIFDIVRRGSFGKCAPAGCAQAPNGLVSWYTGDQRDYRSPVFSQDFSSNMNGVTTVSGNVTLEGGQLRTTAPAGGVATARITAAQSVPVKFSALVTATSLATEGPELRVTDGGGTTYYVDYFHASQQLRIIRNNTAIASVPAVLPLNTQTPMSLEIVTQSGMPALIGRLGSFVVTAADQHAGTITQFDLTGYTDGESGLWDNVQVGDAYVRDARSSNHGTPMGASTAAGKVGRGMKFDGLDDYVSIPDDPSLKPSALTLETWVKFDSLTSTVTGGAPSGYQLLIFKQNTRAAGSGFEEAYVLNKQPNNTLSIGFNSASAQTSSATSTTAVQAGQWYHVVGTNDGTTVKIYINGQLESTGPVAAPIDHGTSPLFLGSAAGIPFNGYFNGVLDETSIYSRAIGATEVAAIYTAGQSGKCKPSPTNAPGNRAAWFTGDGDARDITGTIPSSSLVGDTTFRVGRVGQAFKFDGNGDVITTPDSPALDFGTGDFAIEGWINTPSGTGVQRIISAGSMADGANNLWSLGYGDICAWGCGQRLNLAVNVGGPYADFSSVPISIRPNTWHHVAVVRSGTTINFYFDGLPAGGVPVGATFPLNGGTSGAILGARYNSNVSDKFEFANGLLDEISLYKRAITGSEVAAIFNAGPAGKNKEKATAAGSNVQTQLTDATVTFVNVTAGGTTSESGSDLAFLPPLPASATFTGLAYNISTTAAYQNGTADDVRVCFNLPSLASIGATNLRLLSLENGNWIDRTGTGNSLSNFCSDNLRQLSKIAIVEGTAPGSYSIRGRITNGTAPEAGVLVNLTGSVFASAVTNTNGDYSFGNLPIGGDYTVTPALAGYDMAPPNRTYTGLSAEVTDADFVSSVIPTASMGDASVTEGDSGSVNANFNITLSTAFPRDVVVFYSTSDGTATGGVDYTSVGAYVIFAPGETVRTVSVPVLGDTLEEGDEVFNISISGTTNATVGDADGRGTIIDNEVRACVAAPANLQSWYRFQGNTSDVFNLHPGGAQGNPAYSAGKVGQAIEFDGVDDSVDLGSWFDYQTFSISMWVNLAPMSEQTSFANILDNNHTGSTNWVIQRDGSQNRFVFGDNSGGGVFFNPTPNTWQMLTVTRDPATGMRVYLDGALIDEDTTVGTIPYNGAQFLRLGRWGGGGRNLKGKVDELDIYTRALTQSEVQTIYNAGNGGKCVPAQCVNAPANLAAWLRAEGNANDSQGSNNGTVQGSVTYAAGKAGQAFSLANGNSYVSVPDAPSMRPDSFTIEGWFNFASYANEFRMLLDKRSGDPSYSSYSLFIYGGLLTAQSTDGSTLGNSLNYSLDLTPGQWYHIAVTRQAGGQQTLYVNGVPVDSNASNASVGYSSAPFTIGHAGGSSFIGLVDEVSVYSRAISAAEIQSIFAAGSAGKCPTLGCAAAEYPFNDDLTSSVPDAPPLSPIGTGQTYVTENVNGVSERVMTYIGGNAVELRPTTGVIPSNQYEITFVTRFNQTYSYTRILDFKDGTTDAGLYVTSGGLTFYGGGGGGPGGVIPPGIWVEIKLTRTAAGIVKGYVNGIEQFSFNDTGNVAVIGPTNALRFFKDDGGENYGGAIAKISLSAGSCGGNSQCAEPPANLTAWYRGDNSPLDWANPPAHAGMENGATFAAGKVGYAFSLDGVNDLVAAPDADKLDITGDLTVEAWVKPAQIQSGEVTLVSKRDTANSNVNYVLFLRDGELRFASRSGGGAFSDIGSGVTLAAAAFSHVAATIENGSLTFYVNGTATSPQSVPTTRSASTGRLTIGAAETSTLSGFFNGLIDEVSIYSRALSSSEVSGIFTAGGAGKCVPGGGALRYSIAGRITDGGGNGLSGVTVALSDGATTFGNLSTDSAGYYLWYNLGPGNNYTVTPTLANYQFTPESRSYTNLNDNVSNANFTAAPTNCTFTVNPESSQPFAAGGGSGSFTVTTQPGCQWIVSPSSSISPWVTINGPFGGNGNGTVNYTVAPNTSILRYGYILLNGTDGHLVGQNTGSGTCPQISPITYGTSLNAQLAVTDCVQSGRYTDQYSFSGTAGDRIMVRVSSSDFAEAVVLQNTANTQIYSFATGGASSDARVPNSYGFFTLPATGTYVISISPWGNGGSPTGSYSLTLHSDRSVPAVTPPSGLIAWFAGEGDARNQQGTGDGVLTGGAYSVDYIGQSFSMDGLSSYLEVPASTNTFNVTSLSVEGWINTSTVNGDPNTAAPRYRNIASKFNGAGGASWSLDMEQGGAIVFSVYDGTPSTFRAVRSSSTLAANEWRHVAATFDASTQEIKLYVNGSDSATLVAGSAPSVNIGQTNAPVRVGAYQDGTLKAFWQGRLDEISVYNRPLDRSEIISIIDSGRSGKVKQATLTNQTTATVGSSTVTFSSATSGSVTETPIDSQSLPAPLPPGQNLRIAFDISTTAPFSGNAIVCFAVPSVSPAAFAAMKVYHLENGVWVDRTLPNNTYPNLCASTPSFSPFAIAGPAAPTAASVTVGGRLLTAGGYGIRNARVDLSLADGSVRSAVTSAFGYYSFDGIAAGQTVQVSVRSKRFTFTQPTRVVDVSDELTSVDFVSIE